MPEADESDTPKCAEAKEWPRSIARREELLAPDHAPARTPDYAAERYWTLPKVIGWIAWRNVAALSSFAADGWRQVKREVLYNHPNSRRGAVMSISAAWRELHDALEDGRIAAFDATGAQLPPAYWGHRRNLTEVTGNRAMLPSANVRERWPVAPAVTTEPVALPCVRWPSPEEPAVTSVPTAAPFRPAESRPKHPGGRPPKYDWNAFTREMMRIANEPDGLPDRPSLMRLMIDWCSRTWGADNVPAESVVRDRIANLYP
jgi:hypothetical protein